MMKSAGRSKHTDWKIKKSEKIAYFLGRIGIFGEQLLIPALMNTFLIFNGVNLASVAIFTLIVKFIDAFDDLVFGFLVDKLDLKKIKFLAKLAGQGRYMPWVRCFIWLFPIVVVAFFLMPANMSEPAKITWFCVTYLLYDLTYTLVDVPTQSLTMTITDVPEERNNLLTIGTILITATMYALSVILSVLISESVGMPLGAVGVLFAVICLVCMIPFTFVVKEHNSEMKNVTEGKTQENYTLRDMVSALAHNKPYLVLQISGFIQSIAQTGGAVGLFVSFYLYGSSTAMIMPGLVAAIFGLIIQAAAPRICEKFGNRNVAAVCFVASGAMGIIMYFLGWANFGLVVAYTIVNGLLGSLRTMASLYMMLQTIDYGKYVNGRDTTGIFNSINTFISKTAPSLASSLGLTILAGFGWVTVNAESFADLAAQNVAQPASALNGLWMINILIPAIGTLIGGILFAVSYKLTDREAKLMSQCMAGEITQEECNAQLSVKVKR